MSEFWPHGSYAITLLGRVLAVKVSGSWNLEGAIRYRRELDAALVDAAITPFAHILDIRDWELATPDALQVLKRPQSETALKQKLLRAQIIPGNSMASAVSLNDIDGSVHDLVTGNSFDDLKPALLERIPEADIPALEQFFAPPSF